MGTGSGRGEAPIDGLEGHLTDAIVEILAGLGMTAGSGLPTAVSDRLEALQDTQVLTLPTSVGDV